MCLNFYDLQLSFSEEVLHPADNYAFVLYVN